jgi:hypothetical protein
MAGKTTPRNGEASLAQSNEAVTSSHDITLDEDGGMESPTDDGTAKSHLLWWQAAFVVTRPGFLQSVRENLTIAEFSGAFGDLGTFIPLTVALAQTGCIDFAAVLFYSGMLHHRASSYSMQIYQLPTLAKPRAGFASLLIVDEMATSILPLRRQVSFTCSWC